MRSLRWRGSALPNGLIPEHGDLEPKRSPEKLPLGSRRGPRRLALCGSRREEHLRQIDQPSRGLIPCGFNAVEFDAKFVSDEIVAVPSVEKVSGHPSPTPMASLWFATVIFF